MANVVKNTTKWGLIDLLCPHTCRGCGRLRSVLCECCKNDILAAEKPPRPFCGVEIFVGGWREGALAKLVREYKYDSVRAAGEVLVDVLDAALPAFEGRQVVVIPLPTIGRHVRERGIDHTLRLAQKLARRRGWKVQRLLVRERDTVQVGAKAAEREAQAKTAYGVVGKVQSEAMYLLLDDVWTTGASMMAAVSVMQKAGARNVAGVVIARGREKDGPEAAS